MIPPAQRLVLERRQAPVALDASRSADRARSCAEKIASPRNELEGMPERRGRGSAPGAAAATGRGRAPTTGHQNSSAAPRNRACSRTWISRVLERRVEQRARSGDPHDDREQQPRDDRVSTSTRTGREWRTGRIHRRRASGDDDAQQQRDRRARAAAAARRPWQQQVLDHVDREQRRVVGAIGDWSATSSTASREPRTTIRQRGTGLPDAPGPRPRRPSGRPPPPAAAAAEHEVERPARQRASTARAAWRPAPCASAGSGQRRSARTRAPRPAPGRPSAQPSHERAGHQARIIGAARADAHEGVALRPDLPRACAR